MVSIAMSCVKYLLFFFNLVFAIIGIAVLVVGSLLQGVYHNYSSFINENFTFLPILIIAAGAIIFVIAFFGCCGTLKENHCMISTFASLLLIISIIEIVAATSAFIFNEDIKDIITDRMDSSLKQYHTFDDVRASWDILQSDLHCCGVNGTSDWKDEIPRSCCLNIPQGEQCTTEYANATGCLDAVYSLIEQNGLILVEIAIVIAVVQVAGIAFACCLAHSIRKGYETV